MAGAADDDDTYVANLLKQDAKKATKKYELVGIDAFNPKRLNSGAPKPNTSFLRHIIRQTDSHNAALLAREAEESSARLRSMNREKHLARKREEDKKQKKADGRLTPVPSDDDTHQTHLGVQRRHGKDEHERDRKRQKGDRGGSANSHSRRHRDNGGDMPRDKRRHEDSDDDRKTTKRRRSCSPHDRERRHRHSREEEDTRRSRRDHTERRHRQRRSYPRSTSRSRSRTPRPDRDEKRRRYRDRSHSPRPAARSSRPNHVSLKSTEDSQKSKRRSPIPASDSDPLEAIVGPIPASAQPLVRSRGRGAHKANLMGIESRFSSTYDPAIDVRPNSDAEDDWGDALEALRDRQKWKQQGADRLKAAGFTDELVKKWEKGDNLDEEDVVWSQKGQAREWDRGKVVDEDGDVGLKADFGRLK